MKIIVFGATGNIGKRVLASGIRMGHEMTAFVRSPEKLYEQQGEQIAKQVKMVIQNIMDPQSVYQALTYQDAAIIAAGNVSYGEEFVRIVDNIVNQSEDHPLFSGRCGLWEVRVCLKFRIQKLWVMTCLASLLCSNIIMKIWIGCGAQSWIGPSCVRER
jgi:hypothetical protein